MITLAGIDDHFRQIAHPAAPASLRRREMAVYRHHFHALGVWLNFDGNQNFI
jgi:hypothetical protein